MLSFKLFSGPVSTQTNQQTDGKVKKRNHTTTMQRKLRNPSFQILGAGTQHTEVFLTVKILPANQRTIQQQPTMLCILVPRAKKSTDLPRPPCSPCSSSAGGSTTVATNRKCRWDILDVGRIPGNRSAYPWEDFGVTDNDDSVSVRKQQVKYQVHSSTPRNSQDGKNGASIWGQETIITSSWGTQYWGGPQISRRVGDRDGASTSTSIYEYLLGSGECNVQTSGVIQEPNTLGIHKKRLGIGKGDAGTAQSVKNPIDHKFKKGRRFHNTTPTLPRSKPDKCVEERIPMKPDREIRLELLHHPTMETQHRGSQVMEGSPSQAPPRSAPAPSLLYYIIKKHYFSEAQHLQATETRGNQARTWSPGPLARGRPGSPHLVLVGPDARQDDVVLLSALERVHARHFDFLEHKSNQTRTAGL